MMMMMMITDYYYHYHYCIFRRNKVWLILILVLFTPPSFPFLYFFFIPPVYKFFVKSLRPNSIASSLVVTALRGRVACSLPLRTLHPALRHLPNCCWVNRKREKIQMAKQALNPGPSSQRYYYYANSVTMPTALHLRI